MEATIEIAGISISKKDWEATPSSVSRLVIVLSERLSLLEERVNQNSQNSSRPPSSDGPAKPDKPAGKKQAPAKKNRGFGRQSTPFELWI
jgi:hypothetical protein